MSEITNNAQRIGRIGVGSWTFPWAIGTVKEHLPSPRMTPVQLVKKAGEVGAAVVQFLDNLPLIGASEAELQEVRATAQECGLELQVGTRGVTPTHLLGYLSVATALGAKLVRTMGGWHGAPLPIDEMESDLREVMPAYAAAGVSLALENYEAYSTLELADLVQKIDHPNLGICLDLTNSFGALESADAILNHLAERTINIHLKEFVVERLPYLMGFAFVGRPVGQGKLPLETIFSRVADFGRKPDVIIELWTPFKKTLAETIVEEEKWARLSVDHLKSTNRFMPSEKKAI
jgi:3-oxoisoapionate decarboxylase